MRESGHDPHADALPRERAVSRPQAEDRDVAPTREPGLFAGTGLIEVCLAGMAVPIALLGLAGNYRSVAVVAVAIAALVVVALGFGIAITRALPDEIPDDDERPPAPRHAHGDT